MGGGQILPTPRDLKNYQADFDAKKRHSTRRDVNLLNMPKKLDFDQTGGGVSSGKNRKIPGTSEWSLCPCFSTAFDEKWCFELLKYRPLKETSRLWYANLSEIAVLLPVSKNYRPRHVSAQNTRKTNMLLIEI